MSYIKKEIKYTTDWYGNPIEPLLEAQRKRYYAANNLNPMLIGRGEYPAPHKCEECVFFVEFVAATPYFKCEKRCMEHDAAGARSGTATQGKHGRACDHKKYWPACALFQERQGPRKYYNGKG